MRFELGRPWSWGLGFWLSFCMLVVGLVGAPAALATSNSPAGEAQAPAADAAAAPLALATPKPFPPGVQLPLPVGVALYVNNISKINEGANTFVGNLDLRIRWTDPRLSFDAKEEGTDRQEYGNEAAFAKLERIWNPQLSITNLVEQDAQIKPGLFIHADGAVEFIQRLKATFETKFLLAAFPFDTQALPVILLSSKYSVGQIELVQEQEDLYNSGMSEKLRIKGWQPQRIDFETKRIRAWNGNFIPQMECRITAKREPGNHLGAIFGPFLLVMLVPTLVTLYAKADVAPRLTAWSGSILALVALSFTYSVRYPFLDNSSLVSQITTTGFVYQLSMITIAITVLNPAVADKLMNRFVQEEALSYMRWSIPLGLFSVLATEALLTAFAW